MTEADLIDANKLLEQKNRSLSNELDKTHADLFKLQDIASDLKNQLDEKKHTEQLAAWAIDRAIETAKLNDNHTNTLTTSSITSMAQGFCDWIKSSSAQLLKPPATETMQ